MALSDDRPPTPEDLVLRYREHGDAEAIGAFFDATAPHLLRVARAVAPDAAAAEDALQETYLAALESLDRWDATRPVVPWLVGILRLKAHEVRRRVRRAPERRRLAPRRAEAAPSEVVACREDEGLVHDALDALPEPYRNVAILRWRYGITPAQIAHARNEPAGTIGSLLFRARERLRRTLSRVSGVLLGVPRGPRGLDAVREAVLDAAVARAAAPTLAAATGAGAAGAALLGGAIMSKKALVVSIAAAAVLAAGGVAILRGPHGGREGPEGAPPPEARVTPRPDAAPPPLAVAPASAGTKPTRTAPSPAAALPPRPPVEGRVRAAEGGPVPDAIVYAIEKGIPGLDELGARPHAPTDLEGRFRLALASPRGLWIGAVAPGRLPAFLDGDTLDPSSGLTITLRAGTEVAVRALDTDGEPSAGEAWVEADRDRGARRFPVPGVLGGAFTRAEAGADGGATLRAPTDGPVVVSFRPHHTRLLTEPPVVRLDRPGGRVEFRVVPSCVLRVRVLDAASGRPLDGPFVGVVHERGSDAVRNGFSTTNPEATGTFELDTGLPPGTYDVEVRADGRRAETVAGVAFDRPGAVREVAVSLAPADAAAGARLVLSWVEEAREGAAPLAPKEDFGHVVLLRRTAPEPSDWFEPTSEGGFSILEGLGRARYDAAHRITTVEQLAPGTYDVLAWHQATGGCAFARGVRVAGGNAGTARLTLAPGLRVPVKDVVGSTTLAKALVVEAEPLGRLPAVCFHSPGSRSQFGPEDEVDPACVLGPFPFESVAVTFEGPDGARRRVVVGVPTRETAPR